MRGGAEESRSEEGDHETRPRKAREKREGGRPEFGVELDIVSF
jgi:hypothetical protein